MYKIIFDKEASKSLKKLPKQEQSRILRKIEALSQNPRPIGVSSLQGNWHGFFRFRIGNYRVIYNIEDKILTICIVKIAHRGNVYQER